MAVRKTLLNSDAGVKLTRIETVTDRGRVDAIHYRLSTLRPSQPRLLADEALAQSAFNVEVAASRRDPTAMRLAQAGH